MSKFFWRARFCAGLLCVVLAASSGRAQDVAAADEGPAVESAANLANPASALDPIYTETAAQKVAREKIAAALAKPITIEFVDTPLAEVLLFLEDATGLDFEIDQSALDDLGVTTDSPTNRHLKDISLRSVLRLILGELELTYMSKDEVLSITSKEKAETELVTVVYPVPDLLETGKEGRLDYDSLIELITSSVFPSHWDAVGGSGSIVPMRRALVISQTEEAHEEIQLLLAALRRNPAWK